MVVMSPKLKAIAARLNDTRRGYGPGTIVIASDVLPPPPRLTSGSLALDVILGGGLPANQWHEWVGDECLRPGTKVLCADLIWRNVEDLSVGDEIVGFDEEPGGLGKGRTSCYRRAQVTSLGRATLPVYAITTPYGVTYASGGHLWLTHRSTPRSAERKRSVQRHWVRTDQLHVGNRIASIGEPWEVEESWEAGYLAGFFDGEGWVDKGTGRVGVAQVIGETFERVFALAEKLGFQPRRHLMTDNPKQPTWQSKETMRFPGRYMDMRFLGSIRPERLMTKSSWSWEGKSTKSVKGSTVPVIAVEYVGEQEVVTIGTSTKTLVADGMLSHNSSGKTTSVMKLVAANQALNPDFITVWVASEDFDEGLARQNGVDRSGIILVNTNVMEEAYQAVLEYLQSMEVDLVVIDSYPGLFPESEWDKELNERAVGVAAYVTGTFFRKSYKATRRSLVEVQRPVTGIFINQWRERIGVMHGDPRTTGGGKAKNYRFYVRLSVRRAEFLVDKKQKIGQRIQFTTIKNKSAPPQQMAAVNYYFRDHGEHKAGDYDLITEVTDMAIYFGIAKGGGGGMYALLGEKFKGKESIATAFRERPDFFKQVWDATLEVGKASRLPDDPDIEELLGKAGGDDDDDEDEEDPVDYVSPAPRRRARAVAKAVEPAPRAPLKAVADAPARRPRRKSASA